MVDNDGRIGRPKPRLRKLEQKILSTRSYIQKLKGQELCKDDNDVVYNGPILWRTDEEARFEQENKQFTERMQIIKQEINRILDN